MQRAPTRRREYPGGDSDGVGPRRPHQDARPSDRGRYPNRGGRHPDQGGYPDGGPPEEDILIEMGDPLEEEDTLVEDLQMEMEDLLMEKDPWTSWWTRTPWSSRTTWTSKTYNSPDSPGDAGYNCLRKHF